jgi:hypothetical protein
MGAGGKPTLLTCPVCRATAIEISERRNLAVLYRQARGPIIPEIPDGVKIRTEHGCIYQCEEKIDYADELRAACTSCGLKWAVSGCRRIEDLEQLLKAQNEIRKPKRTVRAADVAADVIQGVRDPELMSKYRLTSRQLEVLLGKLVAKGLLTRAQMDQRADLTDTAVTKAFVETNRSIAELGATDSQIVNLPKITAEPEEVTTATVSRTISVRLFLNDVKHGMTDEALMSKYSLNPRQLEFMYQRLVDANLMTVEQLYERVGMYGSAITKAFAEVYNSMTELDD